MNSLNNDISDASLIKLLCQQNKRHIQEIERLQTLNKELEEYVPELKRKLEILQKAEKNKKDKIVERVEVVIAKVDEDNQSTDKKRKKVINQLDYIKIVKEQHNILQNKYVKLIKEHDRVKEELVKSNMRLYEMINANNSIGD